jgi:hypothetical protein
MAAVVYPLNAEHAEMMDDCAVSRATVLLTEVELFSVLLSQFD